MILFGLATTTRRRAWLCSRFVEFSSLPRTLFAFFSPQGRSTPSHMEDHPPHRPKYGDIWSHPLPVHVTDPPQQRRVGENSSSIRDPVLRRRVDRSEPGPFISPSYTHITDMHPCSPHMCADGHSRARLRGPAPMRFSRRVSRDTSRRTRQPRAACLARFRTSSSLEAERRPDGNDTARERGSVGSTGAPCPARVAPAWGGRGWRDNVRRRANRDPPQASTHRHILHHVRVTIYKITPAITDASARHGTSSSVSAL